jgi:uncharacterized membrane protein YgcG
LRLDPLIVCFRRGTSIGQRRRPRFPQHHHSFHHYRLSHFYGEPSFGITMVSYAWVAFALLTARTVAQGVLSNGNSQFPACAQSCSLVNQAAQACGGTASADQGIWSCFCQSAYLRTLYTSPAGVCDATCTNAADTQQLMTWYKSNCGTDNGVSEHAAASSNTGAAGSAGSTGSSGSTGSTGSTGSSGSTGGLGGGGDSSIQVLDVEDGGTWWQYHYVSTYIVWDGWQTFTDWACSNGSSC